MIGYSPTCVNKTFHIYAYSHPLYFLKMIFTHPLCKRCNMHTPCHILLKLISSCCFAPCERLFFGSKSFQLPEIVLSTPNYVYSKESTLSGYSDLYEKGICWCSSPMFRFKGEHSFLVSKQKVLSPSKINVSGGTVSYVTFLGLVIGLCG